mgnify:CR=1 FL=1
MALSLYNLNRQICTIVVKVFMIYDIPVYTWCVHVIAKYIVLYNWVVKWSFAVLWNYFIHVYFDIAY